MKINVITYARVSSDIQNYNRQIKDIEVFCKGHNYNIVNTFSEKESGKKRQRNELTSMINYVSDSYNNITFVVISELSRIGRTSEVLKTVETLNNLKIGLISLKENLKTLNDDKTVNSTSQMIISVLSSINSYELDTLNYRIKSGLLNAARNGHAGGSTNYPYGYMKDENKMLVINHQEAETVKLIFDMYLQGKGTYQIANFLNGNNIPTRKGPKWRDKVVLEIIKNTIYIGKRRFKGEILNAPVIIDELTYNKGNQLRVSNFNKSDKGNKYEYLLNQQMIVCGTCGRSYFAHKRANGNDNAYKCLSKRYNENCGNPSIHIDKLEYAVKYVFAREFINLIKIDQSETQQIENEILAFEKELKNIEKEQNKLIELYTNDLINIQQFKEKNENYKKKISNLGCVIEKNKMKLGDITTSQQVLLSLNFKLKNGQYQLDKLDIKKDYIRQVIKNITISKSNKTLTDNKQDVNVKAEIISYSGQKIEIFLSQRAKFFNYNNQNIDY
jgi:site-specific DNA recombinase